MVNKSKNKEANEMIKPNIINGLDFTFSTSLGMLREEEESLSFFLFRRLEKGLITINLRFEVITLNF